MIGLVVWPTIIQSKYNYFPYLKLCSLNHLKLRKNQYITTTKSLAQKKWKDSFLF